MTLRLRKVRRVDAETLSEWDAAMTEGRACFVTASAFSER